MGLNPTMKTDLLNHLFANDAIAAIGDTAGLLPSAAPGVFYISLHTANPAASDEQTNNEANYTGYARVSVVRSDGLWTIAAGSCSNAALITFGECTALSSTVTYFGIGTDTSGAGHLLASGALTNPASLAVTVGITPEFAIGALTVTD